jgi:serine/threonine protein kinase
MVDQFGHFKVLDRIGGGAVEVYRARDTRAGRTVALKVLPADFDPAEREKLLQRALAVSRLSHPNIAALHEVGDDGGPFLVFEFVPGQSLATLVAAGALNPRRAVDLATQMADALAEAHAAGIAHGAITTDTVIVTPKGPAKILDFGLTAWTNGYSPSRSASADPARADIEALGAILFEMLTGRAATSGPLTPSAVNRSVPRELDPIVMKAFGRSAENRYDSAVMVAADLRTVAGALEQRSSTAPAPPVIAGRTKRSPVLWTAVVLLLAVLAAAAAWWWL